MIVHSPYPDVEIPDVPLTPFVLRHVDRRHDSPALIDGASDRMLTYRQLAERVQRAAAGLAHHGLRQRDVCAICVPNDLEYIVAFHAVASLGGIVTAINPFCTTDELAHRLTDANASFLLTTPEHLHRGREAVAQSPVRETIVFGTMPGATSFASLLDSPPAMPETVIDARDDLVALLYSSGTGGWAKGVMTTHRHLVAGLCQLASCEPLAAGEAVLGILPFFHMYGLAVANFVLSQGATLVIMPRFDLTSCLRALQDHNVSRAYLSPPIVVRLAKEPLVDDCDLSHLEAVHIGAAPLAEAVARDCATRLGCLIKQGYALTECYPAIRMGSADPDLARITSVGRCVPNTECRVVDPETGSDLGPGQAGELWLRGPQVMQGYLNQPEATAQAITPDGWLRTGDIGSVDEAGFFTIVDRLKELIKYKGYQVAPAELEAVLLAHPAVSDAAVIPSPDEEAGEVPKAFVVLKSGVTPEALMAYVADRVAPYKKIRRVEFVDAIPKSPSGKILRRMLVARERASLAVPVLV
jgi:acyl-CoA synthetase (AMP-forming)/AMP-acid ligase II